VRKQAQNDCAECFSISGYCFRFVAVLLLSQINLSGSGLDIITQLSQRGWFASALM